MYGFGDKEGVFCIRNLKSGQVSSHGTADFIFRRREKTNDYSKRFLYPLAVPVYGFGDKEGVFCIRNLKSGQVSSQRTADFIFRRKEKNNDYSKRFLYPLAVPMYGFGDKEGVFCIRNLKSGQVSSHGTADFIFRRREKTNDYSKRFLYPLAVKGAFYFMRKAYKNRDPIKNQVPVFFGA